MQPGDSPIYWCGSDRVRSLDDIIGYDLGRLFDRRLNDNQAIPQVNLLISRYRMDRELIQT
jgi:hypothetical protein